jgi:hypothetical protein
MPIDFVGSLPYYEKEQLEDPGVHNYTIMVHTSEEGDRDLCVFEHGPYKRKVVRATRQEMNDLLGVDEFDYDVFLKKIKELNH